MNLQQLHHFWFGDIALTREYYEKQIPQWFFGKNPVFDEECKNHFSPWLDEDLPFLSVKENLAAIILLDQVPRNSFRNEKKTYAFDSKARELCLRSLDTVFEQTLLYQKEFSCTCHFSTQKCLQ